MRASALPLPLLQLQLVLVWLALLVSCSSGRAPTAESQRGQVDDTSGARLAPRELLARSVLAAANNKTTQLASIRTKSASSNRATTNNQEQRSSQRPTADKEGAFEVSGKADSSIGQVAAASNGNWRFKRRTTSTRAGAPPNAGDGLIAKRKTVNATIGATKKNLPVRLAMTSVERPGGATSDHLSKTAGGEQQQQERQKQLQQDYLTRLYLDTNVPLEVQTHIGNTAYLMCRLRAFQKQEQHLRVSWVRNMQILTSGEFRYTSDERFRPTHVPGTQDWVLEVHNVNANDEGVYECQVNSEPKPASVSLYLHVMTASLEILESPRVQVAEDDQIRLTCRVEFNSQAQSLGNNNPDEMNHETVSNMETEGPSGGSSNQSESEATTEQQEEEAAAATTTAAMATPTRLAGALSSQHYIYWYKDNISLEYNNQRGGIRVERRDNATSMESLLTVEGASSADSGTYLCRIVPELNEVPIAQTQVLVGGPGSSSTSSRAGHKFVSVCLQASFPLLIATITEQLTRCGPVTLC